MQPKLKGEKLILPFISELPDEANLNNTIILTHLEQIQFLA